MHNADMHDISAATNVSKITTAAAGTTTANSLMRLEFSTKLLPPNKITKLSEIMLEKIERKEFFYGIELMPRASKTPVTLNYNHFETLMPLFTSIVWLGAEYLTVNSVDDIQAVQLAKELHDKTFVLPHLSAYQMQRRRLQDLLNLNFSNILLVRGDHVDSKQEFKYASELVKEVRQIRGDTISIGVAGYPEGHPDSKSIEDDIHFLKKKVDAGADFIITQICYSSKAIIDFIKKCRKYNVNVPIVVGIFAPENIRPIQFIAEIAQIHMAENDYTKLKLLTSSSEEFCDYTAQLAKQIIQDILATNLQVYGFQFYTFNKFRNVQKIIHELNFESEKDMATLNDLNDLN